MDQVVINERIARAHRIAAHELRDCLEEFLAEDPDWARSKQYYCDIFIGEIYVDSDGVKDYNPDNLSKLMPCVIKELESEEFNSHITEVILDYKQSVMNRKILQQSASAILYASFPKEEVDKCLINSYSDTQVIISSNKEKSRFSHKMTLDELISKVGSTSKIDDLLQEV